MSDHSAQDYAHDLAAAVAYLADKTQHFNDTDLEQPYAWHAHQEGVRFALIGTYHELRELAVGLAAERQRQGNPLTRTQLTLGQYNNAYRDLDAVLLGVTDEEYDRVPEPNEWPLRYVLGHTAATERAFFTLVHYGRARQHSEEELPAKLPDGEADRVTIPMDTLREMMDHKPMADMRAFHTSLRERALREFADMSDAELDGPSFWWEGITYNLEHRLRRFDAHLRQHTIQAEKTLEMLGRQTNEAKRLLRLIYNALAEVENMTIGAADIGQDKQEALAMEICTRADEVTMLVNRAGEIATAVTQGDLGRVQELVAIEPRLVNALSPNRIPVLMTALYYNRPEIAEALAEAGAELDIFAAAALGRLEGVQAAYEEWPGWINEFSRDGYTPLQLACFFGSVPVARWLVEQGATIHAVSRNEAAVQPVHAAAAGADRSLAILSLLLEKGADPNARQSGGFVPLHTAAQNNNLAMADLLLSHGADPTLANDEGKTALDIAQEAGHEGVLQRMKVEG